MKIPELKRGQSVILDWSDSRSLLGWTYNPEAKRTPGYIRSIGFIIQANDECIAITTSMDAKGASLDDFAIPVGCIVDLKVLPDEWSFNGKAQP